MARQVAVVTGASSGVGRATARRLASAGWDVGLIARNARALEHARVEIERRGGRACARVVDVSDAAAVERAAGEIEAELGPIEAWVNSAMISVYAETHELAAEELARVTEVTYLGTAHGTLSALRRMLPRDRGTIVQVGSALAYRAIPLQSAYCAAKHAVKGFTDSLRCELLHRGSRVRVCMVQLPAINTPHFEVARSRLSRAPRPVPPVYQPELAAEAVLAAVLRPRREIVVGIRSALAILGQRLAPGLLDRYLARMGYDAQQLDEPAGERRDNFDSPPGRDLGARGRFGAESLSRSPHFWYALRRRTVLAAAAAAAAALVLRAALNGWNAKKKGAKSGSE